MRLSPRRETRLAGLGDAPRRAVSVSFWGKTGGLTTLFAMGDHAPYTGGQCLAQILESSPSVVARGLYMGHVLLCLLPSLAVLTLASDANPDEVQVRKQPSPKAGAQDEVVVYDQAGELRVAFRDDEEPSI